MLTDTHTPPTKLTDSKWTFNICWRYFCQHITWIDFQSFAAEQISPTFIHSRHISPRMLAKLKNQMEFNRIQFLLLLLLSSSPLLFFFSFAGLLWTLRLRYALCIDKSGKLKCYFNYPWWNYGYRWKYFMMRFCWWHHHQHYHGCAYGSNETDILDVIAGSFERVCICKHFYGPCYKYIHILRFKHGQPELHVNTNKWRVCESKPNFFWC